MRAAVKLTVHSIVFAFVALVGWDSFGQPLSASWVYMHPTTFADEAEVFDGKVVLLGRGPRGLLRTVISLHGPVIDATAPLDPSLSPDVRGSIGDSGHIGVRTVGYSESGSECYASQVLRTCLRVGHVYEPDGERNEPAHVGLLSDSSFVSMAVGVGPSGELAIGGVLRGPVDFDLDGSVDVIVEQDSLVVMVFSKEGRFGHEVFLPDTLEDIHDLVFGSDGSLYVGARGGDDVSRWRDILLKVEKGGSSRVLWSKGGFVSPRSIPGDGILALRSAHPDSTSEIEYVVLGSDGEVGRSLRVRAVDHPNSCVLAQSAAANLSGDIVIAATFGGSLDLNGDGVEDATTILPALCAEGPLSLILVGYRLDGSVRFHESFGPEVYGGNCCRYLHMAGEESVVFAGEWRGRVDLDQDGYLDIDSAASVHYAVLYDWSIGSRNVREDVLFWAPNVSAYPNPCSGRCIVEIAGFQHGAVGIRVYDIAGREIHESTTFLSAPGTHRMQLDLAGHPSGIYLYRVIGPNAAAAGTLTLVQ